MLSHWRSGRCADSGRGWGAFTSDLTTASPPQPGTRLTLAPPGVRRALLCRFSASGQKLTGSALLRGRAAVAPLAAALNSTIAAGGARCTGSARVIILLGDGRQVTALDIAIGGCPYLNNPATVATYRHTALLRIITADLAAH